MTADKNEILSFARSQYKVGTDTKANWNGRQIRNAFQTATALADFEAQKAEDSQIGPGPKRAVHTRLHSGHFHVVADASLHFDLYMNEIDDNTENDRNDDFDQVATIYSEQTEAGGTYRPSVPLGALASRKYNSTTHNGQEVRHQGILPSVASVNRNANPLAYQSREIQQTQKPYKPQRKFKRTEPEPAQDTRPAQTSSAPTAKGPRQPGSGASAAARKEAFVESKRRQLAPQNPGANTIAAGMDDSESDDGSDANFSESEEEEREDEE